jgi:hypothetical protein
MINPLLTAAPWLCVCGRSHAPWWRSTPPPSCPHGWPAEPTRLPEPVVSRLIADLLDATARERP